MRKSRIAIVVMLIAVVALSAPVSAHFAFQSLDTKAERMVEIADEAIQKVLDYAALVEANATAMTMIEIAELDAQFYGNVSRCVEAGTTVGGEVVAEDGDGWALLASANQSLLVGEYEESIDASQAALEVFREVFRSIHVILCDAGVEQGRLVNGQGLLEAIERSLERITELRILLSDDVEVISKLDDAENLLNEAKELLLQAEVGDATENLREANILISQVCQYLKQVAEELNPSRIRGYLDEAYCYRERFRERFRGGWDEGFDVDGFLRSFGYENENEFMARLQEMIENADGEFEDMEEIIEKLNEIGETIRQMDKAFNEEMEHHRGRHGSSYFGGGLGGSGN